MNAILNATLKKDICFLFFLLIIMAVLFLLTKRMEEVKSSKWRLLYLLPIVLFFFYVGIYGLEWELLVACLGCVGMLAGFLKENVRIRQFASVAGGILVVVSIGLCMAIPGYRMPDYEEDFKLAVEELKRHYVLAEHKKIDWDALTEKYAPLFQQANESHDETAATIAWTKFAAEFNDGHVNYVPVEGNVVSKEQMEKTAEALYGNDYGLSLMTLENGTTVAINVEPDSEAAKAGIQNGTVITAWDGKSIEDVIASVRKQDIMGGFACAENEAFYETLYVAGQGGEQVTVSYLDGMGTSLEVVLSKMGYYHTRLEDTMKKMNRDTEISNLEWVDVNEKTTLLCMRSMQYDSKENYGEMANVLRQQLMEWKERGVTNLVIDLRNNSGGSANHGKTILQLFAPEGEHIYGWDGVFNTETMQYEKLETTDVLPGENEESAGNETDKGMMQEKSETGELRYRVGTNATYQGENLWSHGEIIILVNSETVSAGDHFTYLASTFPNVKVLGLTHTNGSSQGTNAVTFSYGILTYSAVLLLNEDGTVFIDSDETRKTATPLDVKIPFDEKAVEAIYNKNEDYVLNYAIEYMGW